MVVWLNGEIAEEAEAFIPALDRGVLFGDGLFETIRAYHGRPFRLNRHLARLRRGCEALRLEMPMADADVERIIAELYRINVGTGDAYVRITLTGGAHDGSKHLLRPGPANLFIVTEPFHGYPHEVYERGMALATASARRNSTSPLSRLKSNNYLEALIAKQEARDKGAEEALFLNERGEIAEAASANIFWAEDGVVFSPDEGCGLLPGITREAVIELCADMGVECRLGRFPLESLLGAEEAFLTVSTGEIIPISSVDGRPPRLSCPGPFTARVSAAYHQLVARELGLPLA